MTTIDNAFMLQADEKLDYNTIARIFREGYSRIPIYDKDKNDILGLLLVKDLVFLSPKDRLTIRTVLKRFGRQILVRPRSFLSLINH